MPTLHGIKVKEKVGYNKPKAGQHIKINPTGFKGYPGLASTVDQIKLYIPKCKIFVEPFAGLGRVSKKVIADFYILNDLSDYAITYLQRNFKDKKYFIMQADFQWCVFLYDSQDTFIFFDPVWIDPMYEDNPLCANPRPNKTIYQEILEWIPHLKSDWMIAGKVDGPLAKWPNIKDNPSGYYHTEVQSRKGKLFGLKARTYLVSNKPFTNHWQLGLDSW